MTLIPTVDEYACAAHGDCALAAPDVFTIEDIAVVTGHGSDDAILAAARACPAGAITVSDAETGRVHVAEEVGLTAKQGEGRDEAEHEARES